MIVAVHRRTLPLALLGVVLFAGACFGFVVPSTGPNPRHYSSASASTSTATATSILVGPTGGVASYMPSTPFRLFSTPDDESTDEDGASLAAEFFKLAQAKGVSIDESDLLDDEDDEDDYAYEGDALDDRSEYASEYDDDYREETGSDDEEDDDDEPNIPQGAIDAFVGYDSKNVDANPTVDIPNAQLYGEVKDRVLDTAGGFVDMLRGPGDDDDDEDDDDGPAAQEYAPPTTVPDADLTAGEVVLLVLTALKNNDNPYVNKGVEILFGYSSPGSQIKQEEGLTPAEYGEFLKETEYKALFEHLEAVSRQTQYIHIHIYITSLWFCFVVAH